jgi:hypothetical protein
VQQQKPYTTGALAVKPPGNVHVIGFRIDNTIGGRMYVGLFTAPAQHKTLQSFCSWYEVSARSHNQLDLRKSSISKSSMAAIANIV